jgi:hypothetical protein
MVRAGRLYRQGYRFESCRYYKKKDKINLGYIKYFLYICIVSNRSLKNQKSPDSLQTDTGIPCRLD